MSPPAKSASSQCGFRAEDHKFEDWLAGKPLWRSRHMRVPGNMTPQIYLATPYRAWAPVLVPLPWCSSVVSIISRMEELGIDRNGGSVCFGQLLGMCDHVSLTIGELHLNWHSLHFLQEVLWHMAVVGQQLNQPNISLFKLKWGCVKGNLRISLPLFPPN